MWGRVLCEVFVKGDVGHCQVDLDNEYIISDDNIMGELTRVKNTSYGRGAIVVVMEITRRYHLLLLEFHEQHNIQRQRWSLGN